MTIAPVLQVVPIGQALVADRYVYIPCIGFFYGLSEGALGLMAKNTQIRNKVAIYAACLFLTAWIVWLGASTWTRCGVWKDSQTLWSNVLARYPRSATANNNLGAMLAQGGRKREAAVLFEKAIRINPYYSAAFNNLGMVYRDIGRSEEAVALFAKATQFDPRFAGAYRNLCKAYAVLGRVREASVAGEWAIAIEPGSAQPYGALGVLYAKTGRGQEALGLFKKALERDPVNPALLFNKTGGDHVLG